MKYVTKKLNDSIKVTGIVNLHFFEFDNDFTTEGERHPFYELVFVNSGRLYISSEDYSGWLLKDQLLIHRGDTEHSLSCGADDEPTVIIIGFECESDDLDIFSTEPTQLDDSEIKNLAEIVKEGRNVFLPPYDIPVYDMKTRKNQAFGAEQVLRLLFEYFLIRLVRKYRYDENSDDGGESPFVINEIISYVSNNYLEKVTIDELAFLFRTNRATLCKEFKRATGKTLVEFINEKKFEKAKRKILSSDDTFTKIAEDMNFESIHYFTRFFKKMSGITPKEFRKINSTK